MKPTHFIRFATIVKFLTKYEYGLGPGSSGRSLGIVRITELRMLNMMLVLYFTMRQEEGRLRGSVSQSWNLKWGNGDL